MAKEGVMGVIRKVQGPVDPKMPAIIEIVGEAFGALLFALALFLLFAM